MNVIYQEVGMDFDGRVFPSIGPEVLKAVVVRNRTPLSKTPYSLDFTVTINADFCRVNTMQTTS